MKFISPKNVAALVVTGIVLSSGSAVAAETATPQPKSTLSAEQKAAREQYKVAIAQYRQAHEAAVTAYKSAVASAKTAKDAAVTAATSKEAKDAARTAFKAALASAKSTKDAAIAALGAKPVAPAKPAS
ncbi:MAG: hypothetical protein RLZZ120_990 [Actinomycetota bacterium]|jgi:hypothetical protein